MILVQYRKLLREVGCRAEQAENEARKRTEENSLMLLNDNAKNCHISTSYILYQIVCFMCEKRG